MASKVVCFLFAQECFNKVITADAVHIGDLS